MNGGDRGAKLDDAIAANLKEIEYGGD